MKPRIAVSGLSSANTLSGTSSARDVTIGAPRFNQRAGVFDEHVVHRHIRLSDGCLRDGWRSRDGNTAQVQDDNLIAQDVSPVHQIG